MTSPLPDSESATVDMQTPDRGPISVGAGLAIMGMYAAGCLLSAFLLTLSYTDLLVENTANPPAHLDSLELFVGDLLTLAVALSPMFFLYMLCAKIIDKA